MEEIDYYLRLEEVAPQDSERYYIILSRTGYVSGESHDESYLLISGGACIPSDGIDTSEVVNEFLEDFCGEDSESYIYDPLVIYGEICHPAKLPEEFFDDYFLFVPEVEKDFLRGYKLFTTSGTENIVELIENIMKEETDLEIDDLLLFRGEELSLATQLSTAFDQKEIDQLLDSETIDG